MKSDVSMTIFNVDVEMSILKKKREELIEEKIEDKVGEFVKVLTELPAKDENELRRILSMLAHDIKNIARQ